MVRKKHEKSRFGGNQLKAGSSLTERRVNVREERHSNERSLIQFSFKDFDSNQEAGQNFSQWQEDGILDDLMGKMKELSNMTITSAQQQRHISIYDDFPDDSEFKHPSYIEADVKWAVIKNIGGQKARVAGYIIGSVFFVVFLDKDHKFYITEKKHT